MKQTREANESRQFMKGKKIETLILLINYKKKMVK